jgi:hypothetical protein
MAVRVPAIFDEVLRNAPDLDASVRGRVERLRDGMRAGERLPELPAGAPHGEVWTAELARRAEAGWLSCDWFFAENYAYRCLADVTGFWQTGRDPFAVTKSAEYASAAHREALEAAVSIDGGDAIERLLLASLFGNRMDLSFAASLERGVAADGADLLIDERSLALERLGSGADAVHFVIDNAGTELSVDLVLAARLIERSGAPVVLHVKVHPAFVSDAITADVLWFLQGGDARATALWGACSEAARACRAVLSGALADGRLRVAAHAFWNGPASLWELPDDLQRLLSAARLVILKGDAHYRRALGDALWPAETPFAAVTRSFPAPLLALRTLKSDPIVGLPRGLEQRLDAEDPRWRVNGRRGVASFGGSLAFAAGDARP